MLSQSCWRRFPGPWGSFLCHLRGAPGQTASLAVPPARGRQGWEPLPEMSRGLGAVDVLVFNPLLPDAEDIFKDSLSILLLLSLCRYIIFL